MPYVVLTKDKSNSLDLRTKVRSVHIEYLEANKPKLLAAGALTEDDSTGGHSGVIIVDTDDRAEAEAFIENNPFTKAVLFESITVSRWRKAFFNYEKLI